MKIVYSWNGLPFYGARCLRHFAEQNPEVELVVFATRANVPFETIEAELGAVSIWWVTADDDLSAKHLGALVGASLFVSSGWNIPVFNRIRRVLWAQDCPSVLVADNCWKGNFRQYVGALFYRIRYRHQFRAVWVPGKSGRRLFNFYGVCDNDIYEGLYTADATVYSNSDPLSRRTKSVLFVGQLIERKGVLELCEAFAQMVASGKAECHELRIAGTGCLEPVVLKYCELCPSIRYLGFLQPREIAKEMRQTRFLVLPSREEHWGLVVHEATLSGCIPLLSRYVGSMPDFLPFDSPAIIELVKVEAIRQVLEIMSAMGSEELDLFGEAASKAAQEINLSRWSDTLLELAQRYGK